MNNLVITEQFIDGTALYLRNLFENPGTNYLFIELHEVVQSIAQDTSLHESILQLCDNYNNSNTSDGDLYLLLCFSQHLRENIAIKPLHKELLNLYYGFTTTMQVKQKMKFLTEPCLTMIPQQS